MKILNFFKTIPYALVSVTITSFIFLCLITWMQFHDSPGSGGTSTLSNTLMFTSILLSFHWMGLTGALSFVFSLLVFLPQNKTKNKLQTFFVNIVSGFALSFLIIVCTVLISTILYIYL